MGHWLGELLCEGIGGLPGVWVKTHRVIQRVELRDACLSPWLPIVVFNKSYDIFAGERVVINPPVETPRIHIAEKLEYGHVHFLPYHGILGPFLNKPVHILGIAVNGIKIGPGPGVRLSTSDFLGPPGFVFGRDSALPSRLEFYALQASQQRGVGGHARQKA
jgi:hypothetical protein